MIPIPHAAESHASDCQGTVRRWWHSVPLACSFFFATCCICHVVTTFVAIPLTQRCFGVRSTSNGNFALGFVLSPVMHGDLFHLAFNMMALVSVGSTLERDRLGSGAFFGICTTIAYLCNIIYFGQQLFIGAFFPGSAACVLGFSAVIFGLIGYDAYDPAMAHVPNRGYSLFGCVQIPAIYFPWAMLAFTFFMFPGSSFLGHLNGVLLGIAIARVVGPSRFTGLDSFIPASWKHSGKYCTPDGATRAGREPQAGWLAPGAGDAGTGGGTMSSILTGFKEKASSAVSGGGSNARDTFTGQGRTLGGGGVAPGNATSSSSGSSSHIV